MDILHTLQKSQKSSVKSSFDSDVRPPSTNDQPVPDPNLPQVLSKVQVLFKDQPDLLKDFTQFLPEYQSVSAHLDLQDVKNFALSNGPEGRSSFIVWFCAGNGGVTVLPTILKIRLAI